MDFDEDGVLTVVKYAVGVPALMLCAVAVFSAPLWLSVLFDNWISQIPGM